MNAQQKLNLSAVTDAVNSRLGIKMDGKESSRLQKQMIKIVYDLVEDLEQIMQRKIVKEDKRLIKDIKQQQHKLRKERRSAAVAAILKNYNYTA